MGSKDNLVRRKDGFYVLKHKTKKYKDGDCIECGQNHKARDLLYRYKAEDLQMVRNYVEDNLRMHSTHNTMKPVWCKKCKALIEYKIKIKHEKNH